MSAARIVIVAYRPKAGKTERLRTLLGVHVPRLQAVGLATERQAITMESSDGIIIEVFEWVSGDAMARAHSHPVALAIWEELAEVADYVPVGTVTEAGKLFSEFAPFDLGTPPPVSAPLPAAAAPAGKSRAHAGNPLDLTRDGTMVSRKK